MTDQQRIERLERIVLLLKAMRRVVTDAELRVLLARLDDEMATE